MLNSNNHTTQTEKCSANDNTYYHAYIGLGSNLGSSYQILQDALVCIAQNPNLHILARSKYYQSKPIDGDGLDYINAAVLLKTAYSPHRLLQTLQAIEQLFGRERPYHHAPRTLDLDILIVKYYRYCNSKHMKLSQELLMQTDLLTIPHPQIHKRAFVLLPLLDIDDALHSQQIPLSTYVPNLLDQQITQLNFKEAAICGDVKCVTCTINN